MKEMKEERRARRWVKKEERVKQEREERVAPQAEPMHQQQKLINPEVLTLDEEELIRKASDPNKNDGGLRQQHAKKGAKN